MNRFKSPETIARRMKLESAFEYHPDRCHHGCSTEVCSCISSQMPLGEVMCVYFISDSTVQGLSKEYDSCPSVKEPASFSEIRRFISVLTKSIYCTISWVSRIRLHVYTTFIENSLQLACCILRYINLLSSPGTWEICLTN